MKSILSIFFLTIASLITYAQEPAKDKDKDKDKEKQLSAFDNKVYARVIDGDTVPFVNLPEFRVATARFHKSNEDYVKWERLKRNVRKVYPYAITARVKMEEYNTELAKIENKKKRKAFIKESEEKVMAEFESDVKKMTVTQGVILMKLIDRETGTSTYAIVDELKGGVNAFMWQGVARLFGHNLKAKYDPYGEDKQIEEIVQMIQRGEL